MTIWASLSFIGFEYRTYTKRAALVFSLMGLITWEAGAAIYGDYWNRQGDVAVGEGFIVAVCLGTV